MQLSNSTKEVRNRSAAIPESLPREENRQTRRAVTQRGGQTNFSLPPNDKRRLGNIARRLVDWFEEHGRKFQWRNPTASEYEQICVEVLLQRTRAETINSHYDQFFNRFPDWASLRQATKAELEKALVPLGLWQRRARALSGLAEYATASGGRFPQERRELQSIPAVGQYVANAILLFQHGQPAPLLDTNMARVLERYIRPRKLADIRYDPWLQAASKYLVSSEEARNVNWAILDLGGTICTPRDPNCPACPLKRGCAYFSKRKTIGIPC